MATNAVAKQPRSDQAYELAEKLKGSVGMALPAHITKEQFSRAFLTALRKTPALVKCDQNSISTAVVTAAQLGLMIDVNGACWLIPYGSECKLVIGYQGLIDLCYRSGLVNSVFADVVCENDKFTYRQGLEQHLDHTPNLHGDRGKPYAVYAIANVKGSDRPVFVVMNSAEVEEVKKSSAAAKSRSSPWYTWPNEMWKKTALKRLAKMLPKSVELANAFDFEDKQEERWAEAAVVDDPFAAGRNALPMKSNASENSDNQQDAVHEEPTVADITKRDESYAFLSGAYEKHQDIDDLLVKHGQPSLQDIPRDTTDKRQIQALWEATKEVRARQ